MSYLKEVYDAEWERRKAYLIKGLFQDIKPLSPVPEEVKAFDSNQPCDVVSAHRSSSSSPYDLPPLIIEKEPSIKNKHDEPEEFYKRLEIRMRKIYRQLFIEDRSEADLDLSDSPITSPKKKVLDEENRAGRSLIDWSSSDGEGHLGSRRDEDDEMGGNGEDKNDEDEEIEENDEDQTVENHELGGNGEDLYDENQKMEVRVSNGKELDSHESSSEVCLKSTPESSRKSDSEKSSNIVEEGDTESPSENIRVAGNSVHASPETEVLEELEVMRTPCYRPSGSLPSRIHEETSPDITMAAVSRSLEAHEDYPSFSPKPAADVSIQTDRQLVSMELTMEYEPLCTSTPGTIEKASKSYERSSGVKDRDEDSRRGKDSEGEVGSFVIGRDRGSRNWEKEGSIGDRHRSTGVEDRDEDSRRGKDSESEVGCIVIARDRGSRNWEKEGSKGDRDRSSRVEGRDEDSRRRKGRGSGDKDRSIGVKGKSSVGKKASEEEKSSSGKKDNASEKEGDISGKKGQAVENEGKSRHKRRRTVSPFSAKRPKYEDAETQTPDYNEERRRKFCGIFRGTPKFFNLCSCAYHVCRRYN